MKKSNLGGQMKKSNLGDTLFTSGKTMKVDILR